MYTVAPKVSGPSVISDQLQHVLLVNPVGGKHSLTSKVMDLVLNQANKGFLEWLWTFDQKQNDRIYRPFAFRLVKQHLLELLEMVK